MRFCLPLVGLLLWVAVSPAVAFRCDHRLIQEGDSSFRVERYCGEPDARVFVGVETVHHSTWYGVQTRELEVWHWYYDRGRGKFAVRLVFRGDVLVLIEDLDRL